MNEPRQLVLRLKGVRTSVGWEDRLRLALDPEAPPRELEKQLGGPTWMRLALAANPAAPIELLIRLAADPSPVVRKRVAGHPRLPGEARRGLVHDTEDPVRRAAREAIRKYPRT
jgi:hypothetical protein